MKNLSVFSREEIGVEQLQALKERFADGDLNEIEFVSLFREIIDKSLSETQLTDLFQKIDANSDGTVDWDELTNYMFLAGSKSTDKDTNEDTNTRYVVNSINENSKNADQTSDLSALRPTNNHKDLITKILPMDKPYQYLTASKDGTVRTWNASTLQYQNTIATGRNWITDCCYMFGSNRLAVSSMNRSIGFFDLATHQLIGEIIDNSRLQSTPMCMEYISQFGDSREALAVGDDTGGLTLSTCSPNWLSLDGRSPASFFGDNGFSSKTKVKKHTDWVTKVKWVPEIRSIVTSSLDTNISIVDIERMIVKFEYCRHKKGIFDIAWSATTRLMASCGMERDISVWNPYSCQRAVATLRGHTASVINLACDDSNWQIISLSSDNVFKVWDVRNHRCIQTFSKTVIRNMFRTKDGKQMKVSAMCFDGKSPCLISGNTGLHRWPLKHELPNDTINEANIESPVCLASYNPVFNQIISAETSGEGMIRTWQVDTGSEISHFTDSAGVDPLTAMVFDSPGRRLITGTHGGQKLSMWNFSNGALVKTFLKRNINQELETKGRKQKQKRWRGKSQKKKSSDKSVLHKNACCSTQHVNQISSEVTCIIDIEKNIRIGAGEFLSQRFVCCSGWDKKIYVWLDENGENQCFPLYVLPSNESKPKKQLQKSQNNEKYHVADVLSILYIPPTYLASSGRDGKILLWNLNSGKFMMQVYQSISSIDHLIYSNKLEIMMACGEDGKLFCFNRSMDLAATIPLDHASGETVCQIKCDISCDHLVTADTAGYIKLWKIAVTEQENGFYLQFFSEWKIGDDKVVSLDIVESARQMDIFLLTSCGNGEVSLWTLDGILIGQFNKKGSNNNNSDLQKGDWQLGRPETYSSSKSRVVPDANNLNFLKTKNTRYFIPVVNRSNFCNDDTNSSNCISNETMPKPNEVWICISLAKQRKTSVKSNTSKDNWESKLNDNVLDVIDVITIIKVNKGEMLVWDGISADGLCQRTIDMHDFIRNTGWIKHPHLTQYISRVFLVKPDNTHYKVLCICIKSMEMRKSKEGAYYCLDSNGCSHRLLPLYTSVTYANVNLRKVAKGIIRSATIRNRQDPFLTPSLKKNCDEKKTKVALKELTEKDDANRLPSKVTADLKLLKLPMIPTKPKRSMGGTQPKRSNLRKKHDQTMDFRRVHEPSIIPRLVKDILKKK